MKRLVRLLVWLVPAAALWACPDTQTHARAVYVLLDTSGSYADEIERAGTIVGYLLATLQPGDSIAVANIGSRSFSEKEIIASLTLDRRPSWANAQKKVLRDKVRAFTRQVEPSRHTDITGGLIQAVQYLRETGAGSKTILIVSDLEEDLEASTVRDLAIDLEAIHVVAVNVIKLRQDNIDPRLYLDRVERWEERVLDAGALDWTMINELENLDRLFPPRG